MILFIRILLAVALLGSLFLAGRRVYRSLPDDDRAAILATDATSTAGRRLVVLTNIASATLKSPVEVYPLDLAAARRQFEASSNSSQTFDEFLMRRLRDVSPVQLQVNRGLAVASLTPGNWWLRATATLDTGEQLEWRLPVTMAAGDQTVELSFDKAYERTKKF
jgi:hypothetical protein